jgi:hypothetical protein
MWEHQKAVLKAPRMADKWAHQRAAQLADRKVRQMVHQMVAKKDKKKVVQKALKSDSWTEQQMAGRWAVQMAPHSADE